MHQYVKIDKPLALFLPLKGLGSWETIWKIFIWQENTQEKKGWIEYNFAGISCLKKKPVKQQEKKKQCGTGKCFTNFAHTGTWSLEVRVGLELAAQLGSSIYIMLIL